jgi:hypothetical protein
MLTPKVVRVLGKGTVGEIERHEELAAAFGLEH